MTYEEALAYIETHTWNRTRPGLSRTRDLLRALGDPQNRLRFIHVAGSNGKGSTCAMLESVLRRAGYRTGLFTSPHLTDFRERICLSGEGISREALAELTAEAAAAADRMPDHPSQFELTTAIALLYFSRAGADIVVLETGMGGALDSTNIIPAPLLAVITNIGLDHTEYLGSTVEEIARAKAGIIKPGSACVCYDSGPEALGVLRGACRERGVPLVTADFSALRILRAGPAGQRISYRGREYDLVLPGAYQARNAAVALEAVDVLRARGLSLPEAAVSAGLYGTRWPARLEVLGYSPLFLLDGGHNPQCAEALAEALPALLPGERAVLLTGVLADKDYPGIFDAVAPLAREFICVTPQSDRALPAEALAAHLRSRGLSARAFDSVGAALDAALAAAGPDGAVTAFGSLYLAGAVREAYASRFRPYVRGRVRAARAAADPGAIAALSARIVERIRALPAWRGARTVMLYRAMPGEADLSALHEEGGKRLVYPRCGPGRGMTALRPLSPEAWQAGAYGIQEPDPARSELVDPEEIDLVLCPCTAFDDAGRRLGMGGGYYDRFLPRCSRAVRAAIAFESQRLPLLPAEPWDVPMDLAVTEAGVYGFSGQSARRTLP